MLNCFLRYFRQVGGRFAQRQLGETNCRFSPDPCKLQARIRRNIQDGISSRGIRQC